MEIRPYTNVTPCWGGEDLDKKLKDQRKNYQYIFLMPTGKFLKSELKRNM